MVDRLLHFLLRDVLAQHWGSPHTNKQQDIDLAHVVEKLLTRRVDERVPVRLLQRELEDSLEHVLLEEVRHKVLVVPTEVYSEIAQRSDSRHPNIIQHRSSGLEGARISADVPMCKCLSLLQSNVAKCVEVFEVSLKIGSGLQREDGEQTTQGQEQVHLLPRQAQRRLCAPAE